MPSRAEQIVTPSTTSVLLGAIVVVDLLADTFAFAQIAGQVLLLLLVVMAEQFLPVVWVHVLLLLNDLTLRLLLRVHTHKYTHTLYTHTHIIDTHTYMQDLST